MKYKLTPEGLVLYITDKHTTIRLESIDEIKQIFPHVMIDKLPEDYPGPEIVHLEISDKCNLSCPYCYVGKKEAKELMTGQWIHIIKRLSEAGVFQITFGGGEPTMRDDLIPLAYYAKQVGLNVAMTSNGVNIPKYYQAELKHFDQINVSFHLAAGGEVFEKALSHLKDNGIRRGINFCLSKTYEHYLDIVLDLANRYEAELLVLTYKPVIGDYENQIPPEEVMRKVKELNDVHVNLYVDGLTCQNCFGSKRFCDISSIGDVYPCSFIRKAQGNLLKENFKDIWDKRLKEVKCPYLAI